MTTLTRRNRFWTAPHGTRRGPGAAVVVLLVSTGLAVVAAPSADATSAFSATWTQRDAESASNGGSVLTCVGSSNCWVAGAATTDGGAHWHNQTYPAGAYAFSISCASTTKCWAVGGATIITTGDGGSTWTPQSAPADVGNLQDVSCVTTTTCEAIGYSSTGRPIAVASTDGGAHWSDQILPSAPFVVSRISCGSTSHCVITGEESAGNSAIGSLISTTDGGAHWVDHNPDSFVGLWAGVSCADTNHCEVVGTHSLPSTSEGVVERTTDGGTTWTETALAPTTARSLSDISCATIISCVAVGGVPQGSVLLRTSDGGNTWGTLAPPANSALDRVACISAATCELTFDPAGQGVARTTDGGASWTQQHYPAFTHGFSGLSCATSQICWAVGPDPYGGNGTGHPQVRKTTDGGVTWQAQSTPATASYTTSIACPTTSKCITVAGILTGKGDGINVTSDGGTSWSAQTIPTAVGSLDNVTCISDQRCWAVGGTTRDSSSNIAGVVLSTTDGGTTWVRQSVPGGTPELHGIACVDSSRCWAVGHTVGIEGVGRSNPAILATTNGGQTWTGQSVPASVTGLDAIACPSLGVCQAIGTNGSSQSGGAGTNGAAAISTTDGGTTWTLGTVPSSVVGITALSCATPRYCRAAALTGTQYPYTPVGMVTTDAGVTWDTEALPAGLIEIDAIDCPAATSCIGGGFDGKNAGQGGGNTSGVILSSQSPTPPDSTTTSLTASNATPGVGVSVTFTAHVVPATATGSVTFTDGSATLGSASVSNGVATFTTSALAGGSHSITAAYQGDSFDAASTSSPVAVTVAKATTTTTLQVSPATPTVGQTVTFTATTSPSSATGTVVFSDGSSTLGSAPLSNGVATMTTSTLAAGSHAVSATYQGDAAHTGSTSPATGVTVAQATTTTTLTGTPQTVTQGQAVTLTATVTPSSATGTVTFTSGSTTLGTANLNGGTAVISTTTLPVGQDPVTASYNGDPANAASTSSPITVTVTQPVVTAGTPTITGTAKVGNRLTANPGTWSPSGVTFTYQWSADGKPITGATGSSFLLNGSQTGLQLTVTVTGSAHGFQPSRAASAPTARVAPGTLTSKVPTIKGTARVSARLIAIPGTWGPAPVTLRYQWYASGRAITGATHSTFTPTRAQIGKHVTVKVTGYKVGYVPASRTSRATSAVSR